VGTVREFFATPSGRFVARYVVVLSVAFVGFGLKPVNDRIVNPYTTFVAREAMVVMNLFGEGASVRDQTLASPRFSVLVHNGCNGLEAILILVCGVLAFPAGWRARVVGIVLGFLAVQVFNVVRIIALFYTGIYRPSWFGVSHVFIWQSLAILLGVVLWLLWVQRYGQRSSAR
jgi:exosortase H (IPTLxxWG-CTERM-specific)